MKRYLDPKNDLVFKRVFGEHPEILRTFLNAVLPLKTKIVSLEYLTPEQVPEIPILKQTIVDVRCKDQSGRQFIVEMQMNWTNAFLQRVVFNASKAYVNQLERNERYKMLQPVFGLSLLDDIFDRNTKDFYHHFKFLNVKKPEKAIEGLELVFVELPKFTQELAANGSSEMIGWLRYLIETGQEEHAPEELAEISPELRSALELAETAAYSRGELDAYHRHWDVIRTEKTLVEDKLEEGLQRGMTRGLEQGLEQGLEHGLIQGRSEGVNLALEKMIASGIPEQDAKRILGLE